MDRKYGLALDVGELLKKEANIQTGEQQTVKEPTFDEVPEEKNDTFVVDWIKNNLARLFVIALVFSSIFVLSQPASLYNIDFNVKNSLVAQYQQKALAEINKEFPAMNPKQRLKMAEAKANQLVQTAEFEQQVKLVANEYKKFYRDGKGQTYLYSADPYYFFRLARNLVEYGMLGDSKTDRAVIKDSLRNFPWGDFPGTNIFPYVLFYFFKISRIFAFSASLVSATFYFPVFIGVLSVLLVFFIARKLTNDFGGFITAFLFSIHPIFLFWNYAGYTDTQVLAQLWSLLSIFLFAFVIDLSNKKKAVVALILLIPLLYYAGFVWTGLFFVPVLFASFLVAYFSIGVIRGAVLNKKLSYLVFLFALVIAGVFVVNYLLSGYLDRILAFLNVAPPLYDIFPTAFSSVTELEGANTISRLVGALGGSLLLLAFLAELLFFLKGLARKTDKLELFSLVWFALMIFPAFKSARFLFFVLPSFVLIAGKGFWRLATGIESLFRSMLRLRMNEFIAKIVGLVLVSLLIFFVLNPNPFVAKTKLPLMTKSIADASNYIKLNSRPDAVIATAWDLGYLWQTFAKRATFFDGGLFGTQRLYWISKALSTSNENVSANILKMLACGEDISVIGDFNDWVKNSPSKLLLFDKLLAATTESEINSISKSLNIPSDAVFCNKTNEVFFVVAESMLYQIPSFDYYANWDLVSASIRKSIKGLSESNATALLQAQYNLSADDAISAYADAQSFVEEIPPKHVDKTSNCEKENEKIFCDNGFVVDTKTANATYQGVHPKSLVFVNGQEKKISDYGDAQLNFSIVVYVSGGEYKSILMDSDLVDKMVVRMFVGEKLNNFDFVFASQESPERIVVYKLKQKK